MEEHIAKMEDINKKTPTEETVETSEIETTTKEIETTTKEISESGDNLINSSEAFSLF